MLHAHTTARSCAQLPCAKRYTQAYKSMAMAASSDSLSTWKRIQPLPPNSAGGGRPLARPLLVLLSLIDVLACCLPDVLACCLPDVLAYCLPDVLACCLPDVLAYCLPDVLAYCLPDVLAYCLPVVLAFLTACLSCLLSLLPA